MAKRYQVPRSGNPKTETQAALKVMETNVLRLKSIVGGLLIDARVGVGIDGEAGIDWGDVGSVAHWSSQLSDLVDEIAGEGEFAE